MGSRIYQQNQQLDALLPPRIGGWEAVLPDGRYDTQTIFDYIDGAGEVYRAYGFRELLARTYEREGRPRIIADLFDMGSPRNAFGVFTHDREGEDVRIGQDSTYKAGLLSFWKGRYFVSLYAEEETAETRRALMELGKSMALAIREEGELPPIVRLLPREGMVEKSLHFFFHHLILNIHYFLADQNLLLLGPETDAVLARYEKAGQEYRILLVAYPDEPRAGEALDEFTGVYMPEAWNTGLVRTEDGKWTAVRRKGRFLMFVLDAPSRSLAEEVVAELEKAAGAPGSEG